MDCLRCRELLVAWLDGELAPSDRALVTLHLGGCPGCAAEAGALRAAGELVAAHLEGARVRSGFQGRFWARARPGGPPASMSARPGPHRLHRDVLRRVGVPVAAAAAVWLAALWWGGLPGLGPREGVAGGPLARVGEEDLEVVEDLDLLQEMDLLVDWELIEELDAVEAYDPEAEWGA